MAGVWIEAKSDFVSFLMIRKGPFVCHWLDVCVGAVVLL